MTEHHLHRYHETRKATLVGAGANVILAIAKVLFGWLGHSSALVADGLHSFSDLLTDLLVILAAKFAHHEADEDHPYGHDRIETAATVALSLFLIIVGLAIVCQPIYQIITHQAQSRPNIYVLWIAFFSVALNEVIYRYTLAVAKRIQSDILQANALHSRSDAASSLVVLIGVAGSILGVAWLDEIAAVIVGVMIIKMGASIGWRNISELVDKGVDQPTLDKIRTEITTVPGVEALHQLRTRKMAGKIMLDVHIIVNNKITVSEGHHIGDHVLKRLYRNIDQVYDVTVHVDSEDDELFSESATLPLRGELLTKLQQVWQHLPYAQVIDNVRLHYIKGKVDIELTLPLTAMVDINTAQQLQQQYQTALSQLPIISRITVLFS